MKLNVKHILYHTLFWIAIMMAFAISEWGYRESFKAAIIFELLFLPSRLIAVYFNWFVLIPRYLYRSKFLKYFFLLLILLLVVGIAHRYFILYWGYPTFFPEWMTGEIKPFNVPRLFQTVLIIVSPVAFTTGFKLFINWFNTRKESEKLKEEKKEAELKFLKAQTNPHFLFNGLNSIYGLALEKSSKTPDLILKLSNILSYSLYDANTELISLDKEVDIIENIIDLQMERFGKRIDLNIIKKGDFEKYKIPPLLLIPLIENAFKHGVKDEIGKCKIDLKITTIDNVFNFSLTNTIPKNYNSTEKGGLGLMNVSRRLDLIYGDNKYFIARKTVDYFVVKLVLKNLDNAT